jgi:hypothetical protein
MHIAGDQCMKTWRVNSGGHEHGMSNTQNRACISAHNLSDTFQYKALAFPLLPSNANCTSTKWEHSAWRWLAERASLEASTDV